MAWSKKAEDKDRTVQIPSAQAQAMADQSKNVKEKPMAEKTTKQLSISASSIEGVTDELKRFTRKLDDLLTIVKATPILKSNHAAIMAVRRASQDVSFEMKKLRGLLSTGE